MKSIDSEPCRSRTGPRGDCIDLLELRSAVSDNRGRVEGPSGPAFAYSHGACELESYSPVIEHSCWVQHPECPCLPVVGCGLLVSWCFLILRSKIAVSEIHFGDLNGRFVRPGGQFFAIILFSRSRFLRLKIASDDFSFRLF